MASVIPTKTSRSRDPVWFEGGESSEESRLPGVLDEFPGDGLVAEGRCNIVSVGQFVCLFVSGRAIVALNPFEAGWGAPVSELVLAGPCSGVFVQPRFSRQNFCKRLSSETSRSWSLNNVNSGVNGTDTGSS